MLLLMPMSHLACTHRPAVTTRAPRDTGSPHGPRKRVTEHASVAQAEATRDIQAHTKALALSDAIAHIAKEEVARVDEMSAIKRAGICEASARAAKRVPDWDEERGPRKGHTNTQQVQNAPRHAALHPRREVATTGETLAPAAKAVEPRTNLAAATPSPSPLCDAFLVTVILCNV
jgi:hypothetical protein